MALALDSSPVCNSDLSATPLRLLSAHSLEELDAWQAAWRHMGREADHPLAQFSWTWACLSAFVDEETPHLLALARGEQLLAVAPLATRRLNGVKRMCLAGVHKLYEPMDFAWTDDAALARLLRALARSGCPLLLERVAADSVCLARIKRAYRGRAIVLVRPQASCPYIQLDDSWLEPEQHLNSGRRSDLRRARRKAEQLGAVTTEIHTPDLSELPELLDTAIAVEAKSWKGEAGTALAHDADRAVFYRQFAEAACVEGTLRICFLRIGDRVAAMQLAIEQGGGFWLLKVGYDARFSGCSPGLLLMRDTIRYAVEAGLSSYEFLGKAEAWTEVWTKTERANVSLRAYPLGFRGLWALAADLAVALWQRRRKKPCN